MVARLRTAGGQVDSERRGDTNAWVLTRLLEPREDQAGQVG
jgi:hypothetical protein